MNNTECVTSDLGRGISVLGRRTSSSTNRLQELGRIGYAALNESQQHTTQPTPSAKPSISSVARPIGNGGSGSGMERYHIRRSNPVIWTFVFGVAAIVFVLLLTAYTTTRRLGLMGAVSTTSYVNVNYYWPYVVHSNDLAFRAWPHSRKEFAKTLGQSSDPPGLRSAMRLAAGTTSSELSTGPKGPGEALINTPSTGANSWPPDAPNWEQCSSRDDPEAMRSSGSVFGYFAMHLQCPVAPTFEPKVKFEPPRLQSSDEMPRSNATNPMVLIGIFSGCNSVTRRDTVRQTWARLQYIADADVQLVFVLANDCESKVAKENAAHHDIIFVDVRESYFTLTPKALALLRYGLQQKADFVMKTDDDSFIFIDRLVSELKRVRKAQGVTGKEEQQPCLYWGRRCSVPLLSDFNNPKLPLFQTSVSKWYYPPHYLRHFEGTAYMCGAAYLMSASLATKVLETDDSHHLADEAPFLPEDASVGHLLGPEGWGNCSCHDYRFILDSRRYHGRHLFSPDVEPCKRADIFSSAISAHGLKPEHMHQIINYSNQDTPAADHPCTKDTTAFSPRNSARSFDEWLWQEELGALQPQFPEINWQKRLEMPPSQPSPDSPLIPIQTVLKVQHTPWCVRHSWAIQIIEQLSYLSEKRNLECMLGLHSIYIDPAHSMQIKLVEDSETLVGYDEESPFSHGIPCYSDNMCDRCFLPESREGIFGALCDPKTWTCKGYDASHQLMVASHKILYPLIGRFVHDTPDPQDMYRSSIESALRIAHLRVTNPSELPRMQARSLRALYERFNGQECANNWIASMAESGEIGAPFSNNKQHVLGVVSAAPPL